MRQLRYVLVVGTVVAAISSVAAGVTICVQKPYGLYGHLWNTHDGTAPTWLGGTGIPKPWCAPTATMNSFIYLENKYPEVYDTRLSAPNPAAARDALRDYMGGCVNGATAEQWWEGKLGYMESHASGLTTYRGMSFWDPSTWGHDVAVLPTHGLPTFEFLLDEMMRCEDVEFWIHWTGAAAEPFTDDNGNGRWDPGEAYLDVNGNGEWDPAENYQDLNRNGQYDPGEPFDDVDGNGVWDSIEQEYNHALTLTSICLEDDNNNGLWDADEETATLDYLDPNDPRGLVLDFIALQGGAIVFNYEYGNGAYLADVRLAYSESPVPEPVTMLGVFLGAWGVGGYLRRRVKAAA